MKIGIDARFYGTLGKGLGRYTQKLIEYLEKIDTENEYVVFLRKENFDEYSPQNKNFTKVLANIPWYSWKEQFYMPILLRRYHLDLVHFPHFNVPALYFGNFVITVHDLILLHHPTVRSTTLPSVYYWFKFLMYKAILRWALFRANHIITVSQFAKEDILRYYKLNPRKISVTYEANSEFIKQKTENKKQKISDKVKDDSGFLKQFTQYKQQNLCKYGIMKPYIVYVGNAYPHKNLDRLITAFSQANVQGRQLVLVGKIDHFYERLVKKVSEENIERVIFTDMVSDEDLEGIYQQAHMYVFPSLYEGFGLPPLEAMARRVPVAASNKTSMPEILGKAAYYFDPEDESAMQNALERVCSDQSLREKLVERGVKHIKKYSWKDMAQQTKNIYMIEK